MMQLGGMQNQQSQGGRTKQASAKVPGHRRPPPPHPAWGLELSCWIVGSVSGDYSGRSPKDGCVDGGQEAGFGTRQLRTLD